MSKRPDDPFSFKTEVEVPKQSSGCLRAIAVPAMGVSLLVLRWWRR